MGSRVAVEPNGTELPSSLSLGWLGAMLPSPPRAFNKININNAHKTFPQNIKRKTAPYSVQRVTCSSMSK
ncbi:MAG: hypothetical protein QW459_03375 [Sulfolobales archaeon]